MHLWESEEIYTKKLSLVELVSKSYIRKEKYRPATTPVASAAPMSCSIYPPWILKWAGLESSGRRLISSIVKTKIIAFFFGNFFFFLLNFQIFGEEKKFFLVGFLTFFS